MLGAGAGGYPATDIDLPAGSVLALYTDGLVELPGQDMGAGLSRLARALAAGPHDCWTTWATAYWPASAPARETTSQCCSPALPVSRPPTGREPAQVREPNWSASARDPASSLPRCRCATLCGLRRGR